MPRRYFIKTFGCQMNEYDSARMADVLNAGAGLIPTDDPAEADVLLMNTCSVREKAEEKVFSLLGEWRRLKARRPQLIIGVGGCVASQEGEAITERAPFVDLVFGPQTLHRLPEMIGELRRTGRPVIDVSFPEIEKFANHLHLAGQSGSDRVLSLMKRGYTALEFKEKVRKLRAVRPDISISSDFIVGFPGESERDFEATLALVRDVGFDQSFSFIYSRRPGTPAASLPDDVEPEAKQQRLARLQAQLETEARTISLSMVGTRQRLLIERAAKRNARELAGRTANNRWVNFAGPATLIGRFVDVLITEALPHSLRGRLADLSGSACAPPAAAIAGG